MRRQAETFAQPQDVAAVGIQMRELVKMLRHQKSAAPRFRKRVRRQLRPRGRRPEFARLRDFDHEPLVRPAPAKAHVRLSGDRTPVAHRIGQRLGDAQTHRLHDFIRGSEADEGVAQSRDGARDQRDIRGKRHLRPFFIDRHGLAGHRGSLRGRRRGPQTFLAKKTIPRPPVCRPLMQVLIENQTDHTIARPQVARLDVASAAELRSMTTDLANQNRFRIVLDLAGVEFVDSSGLGALIHMHKTVEGRGRLVLCNVDPKVAQLFKITRLQRVFAIADTRDAAAALVKT